MKVSVLTAATALLTASPAAAHHSFAMFDLAREQALVGTIKEVQFTNPHVWLQVLVPDDKGGQTEWGLEAGAPGMLLRTGWKVNTLKPGDKVSLVMHPAKSGATNGSLIRITVPDGRTLGPGGAPPALKPAG